MSNGVFPVMLSAALAFATVLSWTFLPDNGGLIPAMLAIVCGCVIAANFAALWVEHVARNRDRQGL